jgi:hypothetical protein
MNAARGEVALVIGGRERRLCLTLGALAEIEAAFGCTRMSELDARMRALSAADLSVVLGALLRGGEPRCGGERRAVCRGDGHGKRLWRAG